MCRPEEGYFKFINYILSTTLITMQTKLDYTVIKTNK